MLRLARLAALASVITACGGGGTTADAFVTYSQSTDPASPHFNDFTREYSLKHWKRLPFRPDEIRRDKISEIRLTN